VTISPLGRTISIHWIVFSKKPYLNPLLSPAVPEHPTPSISTYVYGRPSMSLITRTAEPAPNRNARKLHHDLRQEPMGERGLDEPVHGHVGLRQAGHGLPVHSEDVVEVARVDHPLGVDGAVLRRVGRAVVEAEVHFALVEVGHLGRDGRYGLAVLIHLLREGSF